jgi:type I restriction enzyme S subunit
LPFEIPSNWSWCKLVDLAIKIGSGSTPRGGKAIYQENGIKFIRSQNVYNDGLRLDDVVYISEEINEQMSSTIIQPNDILLNITGASIGRCTTVPFDFDIGNINQHVSIIRLVDKRLQSFTHKVLISSYIQTVIKNIQVGAAQEGLPAEKQKELPIPLPPIAEQQRIVAVIESVFTAISEIECAKTTLQSAVATMKQKILSLAISGKLVPQNPEDEPASVLLERIRAERESLIKAGKIKREKSNSAIVKSDDNSYYGNLPIGWVLTSLENISKIVMGQSPSSDSITENTGKLEFHQGKIFFTDKYLAYSEQYTNMGNKIAEKNSLLLCVRAPVGIVNITNRKVAIGRGLCSLKPFMEISVDFLFYWLTAFQNNFIEQATGTTFIAITSEIVKQQLIPLPPLPEQHRIVEAIKSIHEQLNEIVKNLN